MGDSGAEPRMRVPVRGQSRGVVVVAIFIGHAVLIYVLTRTPSLERETADQFSSRPIYLTPFIVEPVAARRSRVLTPRREVRPTATESTALTIAEPVPSSETADTPSPQVDWAQEATAAAREVTRPKSGPRQFGDRPEEEPPPQGKYDRPLLKPPAHRAGDIEMLGPGIERRWVSENCYMEFGHPLPELFPAPGPKVNPVRCRLGSVDGHIFDHLKPEYLKQK